MSEVIIKEDIIIEELIYEIRGMQVMLDSDLAILYNVETGALNRQVKRNAERFDDDFYFQLTEEEYKSLRCQHGISKTEKRGGRRTMPYVFTEMGVTTLASVLHSSVAVQMSKRIIRAFVVMRHYISSNLIQQQYVNNLVFEHDKKIKLLQSSFDKFEQKRKSNEIFFSGQIFDAYEKIYEIFSEAKKKLIIIDNYADNTVLDIIKRLDVKVIIITKENNLLTHQDILKYCKQYHNLRVVYNNTFHDRYFMIDYTNIYHCGASINRIGYKTFCINRINDEKVCQILRDQINKII